MGRWEPDAAGRLRRAALELFADPGFEETTVTAIAARAGVTERTFFRLFSDKREVLYDSAETLDKRAVAAVADAPAEMSALDVVGVAMVAIGGELSDLDYSRFRQQLIMTNPSLLERELLKLASLSTRVSEALRARGVAPLEATLAADAGIAVFRAGFETWVADAAGRDLPAHVADAFTALRALVIPAP